MGGLKNRVIVRSLVILLLLAGITLSATGRSERLLGRLGMESLRASNEIYLQASFDRALKGFIALSGLKMGLAVIKDSEAGISIGVSTQLHLGGLVQSVYDYVDIAWKTLLAGSGILLGMQYILDALALIDAPFLAATLVVILFMLLLKWFFPSALRSYRLTRDAGLVMFVVTLAFYLVVPLSISGAAMLSSYITAPSIAEAQAGVEDLKRELFPERGAEAEGLMERLRGAKQKIEDVADYLKVRTKEITVWMIKLITGYLFDCIIFPLLLFIVLFRIVKTAAVYGFGINREEDLRRDLKQILSEYFDRDKRPFSPLLKEGESDSSNES